MKPKTEAALKAVGFVLAVNVLAFGFRFIADWLGLKPGIDYRATQPPGGIYVGELGVIAVAVVYYIEKVRRH